MKVKHLIEYLSAMPPDADVVCMSPRPSCETAHFVYEIDDIEDLTEPADAEKTVVLNISDTGV